MGKAYFIRKLNSDTKAALLHSPTCIEVLQSSWQREVSFILLHTSYPTPGWTTASVALLICPRMPMSSYIAEEHLSEAGTAAL